MFGLCGVTEFRRNIKRAKKLGAALQVIGLEGLFLCVAAFCHAFIIF